MDIRKLKTLLENEHSEYDKRIQDAATEFHMKFSEEPLKFDGGWDEKYPTLTNEDGTIIIQFMHFKDSTHFAGSGHVYYKLGDKWYTQDRRGIDDSFYYSKEHDILDCIKEALAKIEKSKQYHATAKSINLGPKTVTLSHEDQSKMVKSLQTGKRYNSVPSGFGTGYSFSTKKGRYSKPASKELSTLVGKPVYYETFDYD